jgi:Late exocytosis, associated with Golgi transport
MIQVIGEKMLLTDISQNESMAASIGEQNATRSDAIFMENNTTHILADSLRVYGSILASGFLLYCILRKRYPRTFAVRQWVSEHKTPLAEDQFGYFSWIWKVYSFKETELLESIALDALCFLRLMTMGLRLSFLGCLNSIWLFPVYTTASDSRFRDDPVTGSTINSLPKYSPRFAATVVAAYIFFGYTMYTIIVEFQWFIGQRHKWLKQFNARNYTILVRNIPSILRSDAVLKEHYQHLYGLNRGKKEMVRCFVIIYMYSNFFSS